jgi:predicted PurR-regulated permease PerM
MLQKIALNAAYLMINSSNMPTLPLTVRRAIEFMGLYFLATTIVMARDIITPLVMAFFLSVMLLPLQRFLKKENPYRAFNCYPAAVCSCSSTTSRVVFFRAGERTT